MQGGFRQFKPCTKLAAASVVALAVANCSSPQVAKGGRTIDPKYGVAASPKVIPDGQPIPKGGGREMVGRPYQIAGQTYVPRENPSGYARVGLASWYGSAFHGRLTANGEIFDRESIAAAHATMPLPSYVRVTNLDNNRSMVVRVNDRGPYHAGRVIDVSERAAEALEFRRAGTARVRVEYVGRASVNGSDDYKLLATLRTDGRTAPFTGAAATMVASAEPAPARRQSVALLESERSRDLGEEDAPQAVRQTVRPVAFAQPAQGGPGSDDNDDEVQEPVNRVAGPAPLPPGRPLDLEAIANGAPASAPVPPSRPVLAGLYYAPVQPLRSAVFTKADPFKELKPQRFVALKVTN